MKVASAMANNPFKHRKHDQDEPDTRERAHHGPHLGEWLKHEDKRMEDAYSSIFLHPHGRPLPPERTCIQGHEILPGEDHCLHGHPVG